VDTAIEAAAAQSRPVVACGELATEPMGYWILLCLGVSRLSVPVRKIAEVRQLAARFPKSEIMKCRKKILTCKSLAELNHCFEEFQNITKL